MRRLARLGALLGLMLLPVTVSAAPGSSRVVLDRVVAVVGDQIILWSELSRQTDRHPLLQEALSQLPANASAELVEQKRRDVESQVLDELIDLELLRAEGRRFEIRVTEQDVDQALPNVAAQYGLTVAELRAQVEASEEYASWAEYRADMRDQILQYRVTQMLATWSVSEAQVREHYRKMTRDESAKVRVHQLTFAAQSQDSEDRDRAFAQAQAVARRLRQGEEPSEVAEAIGLDPDTETTIGRGDIAPSLEESIFSAQAGAVVGPTASGQGYVVFKVVEHVESAALDYEAAKDRIREQLEAQAFYKAEQELRRQLRAKAHIDIRL
ncbi:MAG: SurA N-terminal domain-containing protein [Myxococcales bacterium]|nr:SurA N-terminal domain-containing protein [Myxococcales bacterium]MCB9716179.1 SurA N-terminal domain-containing protein [Myxococcales bacterium]